MVERLVYTEDVGSSSLSPPTIFTVVLNGRILMNTDALQAHATNALNAVIGWAISPQFYAQIGVIVVALLAAYMLTGVVRRNTALFSEPEEGAKLYKLRVFIHSLAIYCFPCWR